MGASRHTSDKDVSRGESSRVSYKTACAESSLLSPSRCCLWAPVAPRLRRPRSLRPAPRRAQRERPNSLRSRTRPSWSRSSSTSSRRGSRPKNFRCSRRPAAFIGARRRRTYVREARYEAREHRYEAPGHAAAVHGRAAAGDGHLRQRRARRSHAATRLHLAGSFGEAGDGQRRHRGRWVVARDACAPRRSPIVSSGTS